MDATTLLSEELQLISKKTTLSLQSKEFQIACKDNQLIKECKINLEQKNIELNQRLMDCETSSLEEKFQYFKEKNQKLVTKHRHNINFKINRALMGYAFVHESWDSENQVEIVTWYYNQLYYVRIAIHSKGLKDLVDIMPTHPSFLDIRRFLLVNQDVAGLLASLLKYFQLMVEKQIEFPQPTNK